VCQNVCPEAPKGANITTVANENLSTAAAAAAVLLLLLLLLWILDVTQRTSLYFHRYSDNLFPSKSRVHLWYTNSDYKI